MGLPSSTCPQGLPHAHECVHVCRHGIETLQKQLEPKLEGVMELRMSPLQDELYKAYLRLVPGRQLLRDHALLMLLLNAPARFEEALRKLGGLAPGEEAQLDGEPHRTGLF